MPGAHGDPQCDAPASGVGVGPPGQSASNLSGLKKLGLGYTNAYFTAASYDTSCMHLFENRVIPELR